MTLRCTPRVLARSLQRARPRCSARNCAVALPLRSWAHRPLPPPPPLRRAVCRSPALDAVLPASGRARYEGNGLWHRLASEVRAAAVGKGGVGGSWRGRHDGDLLVEMLRTELKRATLGPSQLCDHGHQQVLRFLHPVAVLDPVRAGTTGGKGGEGEPKQIGPGGRGHPPANLAALFPSASCRLTGRFPPCTHRLLAPTMQPIAG